MGLEPLLNMLSEGWDYISPFFVINDYERGIVLRFGKLSREVGPGLRWKWPLVEYCMTANTTVTTAQTSHQIIGDLALRVVITYKVHDVTKFLLNVGDDGDFLTDSAEAAVKKAVDSGEEDVEEATLLLLRKYVKGYGFTIRHVALVDFAKARTFYLVNSQV